MGLLNLVVILALLATIGALVFGLVSMARGGDYDARHSEQFMTARLISQSVALVLIIVALFLINT